jgi:YD repeat-containing protein
MKRRLPLRLILLGIALILTSGTARAQFTAVTGSTQTPAGGVGHDYIRMLNETVDPSSGNVSVRLPALMPAGRKLTVPLSFNYDSNGAFILEAQGWSTGLATPIWTNDPTQPYGWSFAPPQLSWTGSVAFMVDPQDSTILGCNLSTGYVFQDPSGTRHSLPISYAYAQIASQNPGTNACQFNNIQGPVMYGNSAGAGSSGTDGIYQAWFSVPSNLSWASASGNSVSAVYVSGPDGTVYTFQNATSASSCSASCQNSVPASTFPSSIEDSNGNVSRPTWSASAPTGLTPFTLTDTAGRTAATVSGSQPNLSVAISGLNGTYAVTFGTATANWLPNQTGGPLAGTSGSCGGVPKLTQSVSVISGITLPNGREYSFTYDPTYGLLRQINYPWGGYVQYVWGVSPLSAQFYYTSSESGTTSYCLYTYDKPAITQRTVSFDGQTVALQQSFTYSTTWDSSSGYWTSKTTTVTTTDNVAGVNYKTVYTYSAIPPISVPNSGTPGADPNIPVEQLIQYYDSNGNLLRTATKQWLTQFELACELDTLDHGAIGGKFYTYGGGGVVTDLKEYDYGQFTSTGSCQGQNFTAPSSPTPVRETITTYQQFAAPPNFPPSPVRILDRPCSVVTKNSGGSPAAETDYFYDNAGPPTVCSAAGTPSVSTVSGLPSGTHDETYFGPSSTSPAPRGNPTTKIRKSFSGNSPTTTYTYDETGQVLSMTDPCGNGMCTDVIGSNHTTTFSYADNYSSGSPTGNTNAYVTKITNPLGYQNVFSYALATGKLTSSKDQNDSNAGRAGTTYTYSDSLARVTAINYPDGGQSTIAYNDSPYSSANTPNMSVTKVMNPSTSATTITAFDGAGHAVRTLTTDPLASGGYDIVDTVYNGKGLVRSTSNPHTSSTLSTNGIKTYIYDGLGRTCLVVPQDVTAPTSGTACPSAAPRGDTFTSYTNNCSTVTDEAGKSRTSCLNILGQMYKVLEDPNGANYETDYQYDPLGNLIGVNQLGGNSGSARTRTFVYDSLSQLQTAANPESGTITYTYDLNGNVVTKTDARNITTTMTYDVLNRVLTKAYSDHTTPTASFFYDTAPAAWGSTPQNAIGRLVEATTGVTPEP